MRSRRSWRISRYQDSNTTEDDDLTVPQQPKMEGSERPIAKQITPAKSPETRRPSVMVTAVDIGPNIVDVEGDKTSPILTQSDKEKEEGDSGSNPTSTDNDDDNNNSHHHDITTASSGSSSDLGNDGEYPEGGIRAWLVVLGAWLALFAALGLMNILATFQTYISNNQLQEYDAGTIGWIFSLYTFVTFFMGIYVGPIFDKYGPRWLVLSGTLCLALSLVLMSISYEFWHFLLAFGILSGVASSLLFTPSIAAIGHFFKARRGLATGIASTAGSVGGIVFPLMLRRLFDTVGWSWAIRTLALLCLAVTIVSNFLIRSRLAPAKDASPHPDVRIFTTNVPFAWTTAAVFLLEFALFIPLTYISSYALSKGFSETFATNLLSILNAGSVLGRVLPGWYADKIGPFNANMISVAVTAVGCFAVWLPAGHTAPGIVIFALVFGFTSGSNISLVPVAIGRLCRTQNYGRYYATCYTLVSLAVLIGIPIAGKIVDASGSSSGGKEDYSGLIILTGAVYIASFAAFWMVKVTVVGKWGRQAALALL